MSVVFIVLPLALVLAAVAVAVFVWAARSGQFDDLATPGIRVLHDDDRPAAGRAGRSEEDQRTGGPVDGAPPGEEGQRLL